LSRDKPEVFICFNVYGNTVNVLLVPYFLMDELHDHPFEVKERSSFCTG